MTPSVDGVLCPLSPSKLRFAEAAEVASLSQGGGDGKTSQGESTLETRYGRVQGANGWVRRGCGCGRGRGCGPSSAIAVVAWRSDQGLTQCFTFRAFRHHRFAFIEVLLRVFLSSAQVYRPIRTTLEDKLRITLHIISFDS